MSILHNKLIQYWLQVDMKPTYDWFQEILSPGLGHFEGVFLLGILLKSEFNKGFFYV